MDSYPSETSRVTRRTVLGGLFALPVLGLTNEIIDKKIALVVGHNPIKRGAVFRHGPAQGETEFHFNTKVANHIKQKSLPGADFEVFHRKFRGSYSKEIKEVYSSVNNWNPDLVIEMHFNSYRSDDYCTCIIAQNASLSSEKAGKTLMTEFSKSLNITPYGILKRNKTERGGLSMYSTKAPSVLTEPFFGDNLEHCRKIDKIGSAGLADIYLKAFQKLI